MIMRKIRPGPKRFFDRRSQRLQQKKRRFHSHELGSSYNTVNPRRELQEFKAPRHLSIVNNPEETNAYFNTIVSAAKLGVFDRRYFFDLSEVEKLTTDAVMYILAVVLNMKSARRYRHSFSGNIPVNLEAASILNESGFYEYVNLSNKGVKKRQKKATSIEKKIQIRAGSSIEPSAAVDICEYLKEQEIDDAVTRKIYTILIELMDNTKQHAYENANGLNRQWYVYVENTPSSVNFSFLDTGIGIPKTVKKKWYEKIFHKNDSDLLLSALRGEFRSVTGLKNRGKGLLEIYEIHESGDISDFSVISDKGKVFLNGDSITTENLTNPAGGTVLSWSVIKREGIYGTENF